MSSDQIIMSSSDKEKLFLVRITREKRAYHEGSRKVLSESCNPKQEIRKHNGKSEITDVTASRSLCANDIDESPGCNGNSCTSKVRPHSSFDCSRSLSNEDESLIREEIESGLAFIRNTTSFKTLHLDLQKEVGTSQWSIPQLKIVDGNEAHCGNQCVMFNEYLTQLMNIPGVTRSKSLATFLSIGDDELNINTARGQEDNKTCFDYVFGGINETNNGEDKIDDNIEALSSIVIPRKETFTKTMIMPSEHWILWRFSIPSNSGLSSPISFSFQLWEALLDVTQVRDEFDTEHCLDASHEHVITEELPLIESKSLEHNVLIHEEIFESHNEAFPNEGSYYNNRNVAAKAVLAFSNKSSFFRSTHISNLQIQVIPNSAYVAACTAAKDQNELISRWKKSPLIRLMMNSAETIQFKVEEVHRSFSPDKVLDEDYPGLTVGETNQNLVKNADKDVQFEDVLSENWSDPTSISSKAPICNHSKRQINMSYIPFIVKHHEDEIKMLRKKLGQTLLRQGKNESRIKHLECLLQESNKEVEQCRQEATIWKTQQLPEIQKSLGILKKDLKQERDKNSVLLQECKVKSDLERHVEVLEVQNKKLLHEKEVAKSESRMLLESSQKELVDTKTMLVVLEGKIRELEASHKKSSLQKPIRNSNLFESFSGNAYSKCDILMPSCVTKSFIHPDKALNSRLIELKSRFVKVAEIVKYDENCGKHIELLSKMANAIQEIIMSSKQS